MKAIHKTYFFLVVFVCTFSLNADLPPKPSSPENTCGAKIKARRSYAHLDKDLQKHEGCTNLKSDHACVRPKNRGSLGHEENALTPNIAIPTAPGDNDQMHGCGNMALMPSAFFSLFGAMAGLFLACKGRRSSGFSKRQGHE